jgi:spermidine synthase
MKAQIKLAEVRAPDGAWLTLHTHDGHFVVRADGQALMHSALADSELWLGKRIAEALRGRKDARALIGGLGLGFTLREALAGLRKDARVRVAELSPEVVEWNRTFLRELNGACLEDPRVELRVGDVGAELRPSRWDVIALDVDNGPEAMVRAGNAKLYGERGVARLAQALSPGGSLLVWSAAGDRGFERRLAGAGLVGVRAEAPRGGARARSRGYVIFVGERAD